MNIVRLFFAAALLLLVVVSCGKKESKSQAKRNAKPAVQQQKQATDASLYEYLESSSDVAAESSPSSSAKVSSSSYSDFSEVKFSANGRYVVQISTVASSELAKSIVKKLEKNGYPAYVAKVENPTTALIGIYYRVRVGGFDRVSDAKYFGENILRPLGYDYWVDNKSNDNLGISGTGLGAYSPSTVNYDAKPVSNAQERTSPSFEVEPVVSSAAETQQPIVSSDNNSSDD
ncbi:MAG: SPOR domain-containing protein [Chitinispirillales bacterium]|jgi:hypothetical protein|nr:SPOR domain-containing protein [Chitinispirillales bacterium]